MNVALLDVNVLIALMDPQHEMHDAAHAWFERNAHHGWATCPITENGCLRILAKLYASLNLGIPDLAGTLRHLRRLKGHHFWHEAHSILDPDRFNLADVKSKTITDVYLVSVACANAGRLVTFDRGIPWQSVTGAKRENLEVL